MTNETKIEETTKEPKPKKKQAYNANRGGKRENSGRKPGATTKLTAAALMEQVMLKGDGRNYEELLVEDFLKARSNNDTQLTLKYHNLLLNKLMSTLTKVEITDDQDQIEAKKLAFAEALAKLVEIKKD